MAQRHSSIAKMNSQMKKTDFKSQIPPARSKENANRARVQTCGKRVRFCQHKTRKPDDLSKRKDFVTIDVDSYRLTPQEVQKRTEDRKSKNQILGQLEAYNQTIPAHSRIAPEVTEKLLKERVMAKSNIFDFDTAMARSDRVLEEARTLLRTTPGQKVSKIVVTPYPTQKHQ